MGHLRLAPSHYHGTPNSMYTQARLPVSGRPQHIRAIPTKLIVKYPNQAGLASPVAYTARFPLKLGDGVDLSLVTYCSPPITLTSPPRRQRHRRRRR
jgi:hypothetical protein